jgi:hypothetical protein
VLSTIQDVAQAPDQQPVHQTSRSSRRWRCLRTRSGSSPFKAERDVHAAFISGAGRLHALRIACGAR